MFEKQRNITRLTIDLKRHPGSSENYCMTWYPTETSKFELQKTPHRHSVHSFITSIIYIYICKYMVYLQPTHLPEKTAIHVSNNRPGSSGIDA